MNKITHFGLHSTIALALAASSVAASAWPKDNAKSTGSVQVVSGMSFDGKPATDMSLERKRGKSYLQLHFTGGETRVIDVTRPDRIVDVEQAGTSAHEQSNDGNVTLVRLSAPAPAEPNQSTEFSLWDISRPGKPRLVQKFTGVNRVIEDQRGYIYVLHRDGVSIVHSKGKDTSKPDMSIYG